MKRFTVFFLLLPVFLAGCTKLEEMGIVKSDKKVLTKGKREVVLFDDEVTLPKVSADAGNVTLPPMQEVSEWPQAQQNAMHSAPHIQANDKLEKIWQVKLGVKSNKNQRLLCEPVVAEGMLFIYTPDSYVSAYGLEDGKLKWTIFVKPKQIQEAILGGGVAYDQGTLFVSTPFAEIFAIDVKSGKGRWMAKVDAPLRASPVVNDGRVYVISLNNELSVFDQASGKLLWTHQGVSESAGVLTGSSPAVYRDVVLAPYTSGEFVALQAATGLPLWSENMASSTRTDSFAGMPHISAKPVVVDGVAYVVSQAGRTAAIDIRTGGVLWSKDFGGSQTPFVAGDSLFLLTGDNLVICLNKNNGLVRWYKILPMWKDEVKNKGRIVWNGPLLAGGKLYMTSSDGAMFALDPATGNKAMDYKLPGEVVVPMIAVGGMLMIVTESGLLVAYR
ncbi:MAG: PQQ-binding-like beta-propeller repeat protein [Alphaproteobacteria bacterium]|nr:PQQ-binding-like beta-propeller repeat protein [Alphaproteobacteria bacterium]